MALIYAGSSNSITFNYSITATRSTSNVITFTVTGTLTGNGSSGNSSNNLYMHLRYNVSPAYSSASTFVSSYGTAIGDPVLVVPKPLNGTSIPKSGRACNGTFSITSTETSFSNVAVFLSSASTAPATNASSMASAGSAYMFVGKELLSISDKQRYATQTISVPALTYTISYNINGGSGTTPTAQTKTYGTNLTLQSTSGFSKTGYTCLGWSTSSSATTASWASGGTYSTNSGATLYAVWQANTYTIYYDANGGTGAPSPTTYTYAPSGYVTLSSTIPTKTGYVFSGWSTSLVTAAYSAGGNYPKNAAYNNTLYAAWQPATYTITYNANGGSGAPSATTYTYASSGNVTLSSTKPTKSNEATSQTITLHLYGNGGKISYQNNLVDDCSDQRTLYRKYTFSKWNTNQYGFGTNYASGASFPKSVTYNTTLYAQYTSQVESSVQFFVPQPQSRTGYTFLGWGTSASATTNLLAPDKYYEFTTNTNLYAIWQPITKTVKFYKNDGSSTYVTRTFTYGVTPLQIFPKFSTLGWSRTGYHATYWDAAADGSYGAHWDLENQGVVDDWIAATTVQTSIYVVWEIDTYTITYNANGGTGAPSSTTYNYAASGNVTLSSTKPTKASTSATPYTVTINANGGSCSTSSLTANRNTSYTFSSWNTAQNGTGTSYSSGGSFPKSVTANTTLYAQYSSSTSTSAVNLPSASWFGHTSQGWNTANSPYGTLYNPGTSFTPSSNVTLYAIWKSIGILYMLINNQ